MKRIPSLDGLRAISITMVIMGHYLSQHHWFSFVSVYANTGVRIFFVISGYLITTLLLREHDQTSTIRLRNFYIRRAYRILPAALAFTIPTLILYRNELHWYQAAAALLYLVNFDFSRPWFIGHLWSLGVEEQFYFLWPSVLRTWFRHRTWILVAVVICSPLYSALCFALKIRGGAYGTFPAVADNLAIGCLAAILAPRIAKIPRSAAICMVGALFLIPQFPATTPVRTLFMLFLLSPVLHASMAGILLHVVQNPYRFLNFVPIMFLGKISYSLYLWQQLFFSNPQPKPLWLALSGALGCACLSYFWIEEPMLRLRDTKPRTTRPALAQFASAGD